MKETKKTFKASDYLAPKYWGLWLWFGLLRLTCYLPYSTIIGLGRFLGSLMYYLIPRRRRISEVNIRLCFPELDKTAQDKLVKESFHSAGISMLEIAWSWWGAKQKLEHLCHIDGLEHLQAAKEQGKGVLLFSAHFTCLEMGGRLLALHTPFHVMYKPHRNPLFEAVMRDGRERQFESAIERDNIRTLIKTLKNGGTCWYALDQDFGYQNAVFAPFFGNQAATLVATSRIAKMTNCAVVPFFSRRREDGSGYQLTILPALENFPSSDDQADATLTNGLIEEEVRKSPAQYLWMHRRFKSQPGGEDGNGVNLYAK